MSRSMSVYLRTRRFHMLVPIFLQMDLQMTFLIISSKAEKNFLYFKLISIASTKIKIKFQATNSLEIASIQSAYLNYYRYILRAVLVNYN